MDFDDDYTDDFLREVDALEEAVMRSRKKMEHPSEAGVVVAKGRGIASTCKSSTTEPTQQAVPVDTRDSPYEGNIDPSRINLSQDFPSADGSSLESGRVNNTSTYRWTVDAISVRDGDAGEEELVGQVSRLSCSWHSQETYAWPSARSAPDIFNPFPPA